MRQKTNQYNPYDIPENRGHDPAIIQRLTFMLYKRQNPAISFHTVFAKRFDGPLCHPDGHQDFSSLACPYEA